jgi:HEAT repeat protein
MITFSTIMRRTAGDALSDLGDGRAVQPAVTALGDDRSKLVQWRAARILGEFGDSMDVVAVLKQASFSDKYAFEVAFEIKNALRKVQARVQTISGVDSVDGATTTRVNTGPVWKQIQDSIDSKS